MTELLRRLRSSHAVGSRRQGSERAERARLAIVLQRIAPDLTAPLWREKSLRNLPVAWREEVADVLGCEVVSHGLDEDEDQNAYGRELGALFDALAL
jgi:hypothetical protein